MRAAFAAALVLTLVSRASAQAAPRASCSGSLRGCAAGRRAAQVVYSLVQGDNALLKGQLIAAGMRGQVLANVYVPSLKEGTGAMPLAFIGRGKPVITLSSNTLSFQIPNARGGSRRYSHPLSPDELSTTPGRISINVLFAPEPGAPTTLLNLTQQSVDSVQDLRALVDGIPDTPQGDVVLEQTFSLPPSDLRQFLGNLRPSGRHFKTHFRGLAPQVVRCPDGRRSKVSYRVEAELRADGRLLFLRATDSSCQGRMTARRD